MDKKAIPNHIRSTKKYFKKDILGNGSENHKRKRKKRKFILELDNWGFIVKIERVSGWKITKSRHQE